MKQTITGVVIGMVAGVVLTMGVVALTGSREYEKSGQQVVSHKDMSMSDMTSQLKGLRGDAYDQAWVEMRMAHHEGAVEMAKLSADRAARRPWPRARRGSPPRARGRTTRGGASGRSRASL